MRYLIKTTLVGFGAVAAVVLGAGAASADIKGDVSVNPDSPASPLDANVTVPVDTSDNAIGTPLGQADLPGYKGDLSTKSTTEVATAEADLSAK
ncbi:hypothetical protein [Amycolatopsis anabasis]|uniref:hypothetical protein n=1 Tax=Amycolatopsis anabasis TaxID=1840409 RepID=UPI0015D2358E|nr:hypothetical protein [Amycolatopsis anabasis]